MRRPAAGGVLAPARAEAPRGRDPGAVLPSASDRSEVRSAVRRFLVTALAVLVLTAAPMTLWIRAVAEDHALAHVLSVTHRLADYAVGPVVTDELLAGGPAAAERLDARLRPWLDDGTIRRIKIWDLDGTVVYSDEHSLIGRNFGEPTWDREALARGEGIVVRERQHGAENAHESGAGELVEVYVGFLPAAGEELVFEAYYDDVIVEEEQRSVLVRMAPALLVALGLCQLAQLVPAVQLARRIQAHRLVRARLLQHAVDAAELERSRVARDLHDDVIQDLAGLSYALEAQEMRAAPDQRTLLTRTRSILQGTLRTLRGITSALYSPDLMELGLPEALKRMLDPLTARGVDTVLEVDPGLGLSVEQECMLFKVARESLANIGKHSHASTVVLRLRREPGAAVLTVEDDGIGFDPSGGPPEGHLGLRIMRDVAVAAGADLDVDSRRGAGTTVVATLPLRP